MSNLFHRDDLIIDDVSSNKIFSIGTYAVLCIVAVAMTVLNIRTEKGFLTVCTGVFSALCIVNIVLALISPICENIAKVLFALEVLCMFTFFLISGNPEGFSAIWICMLPSLGMFFFNRIRGTALCIAMFFILVFFLWLPYGQSLLMYEYTDTFKMRFPVLFIAFHMLAFFLETLRFNANRNMRRLQEHYKNLSRIDQLTQILNRQGMYSELETQMMYKQTYKLTAVMFDMDDFKLVNDKYGHNAGDSVLKEFAQILSEVLVGSTLCRWGGEEFVVIFPDNRVRITKFEEARNQIERKRFLCGDDEFGVTVSIGVAASSDISMKEIDTLINRADEALYKAKATGKNKLVFYGS